MFSMYVDGYNCIVYSLYDVTLHGLGISLLMCSNMIIICGSNMSISI